MSYQAVEAVFGAPREIKGRDRLVLTVLASHADKNGGRAWPSVATIAVKANVSQRTVQYALRRLEKAGVIMVTARANGGRGKPTVYSLTPLMGMVRQMPDREALSSRPQTVQETAQETRNDVERAQGEADGRLKLAPEPSSPNRPLGSSLETSGGSRGPKSASDADLKPPTPRELARISRDFQRQAAAVWEAAARKAGNPYIDPAALRRVKFLAVDALQHEDENTILDGIRKGMDQKSSPVRIREWALDQGSRNRALAYEVQRRRERDERPDDPAVAEHIVAVAAAMELPHGAKRQNAERAADEAVWRSHKQRGRVRCSCGVCGVVRARFGINIRATTEDVATA